MKVFNLIFKNIKILIFGWGTIFPLSFLIPRKLNLEPVDVGSLYCNEIDFEEDLKAVRDYLSKEAGCRR